MALLNPQVTKLPNGITIVVIPRAGETVEMTVWIKDGSRGDAAARAGELHMLEHGVYKGTKKLPHWRDVNQLLRWYGRDDGASAATSHEFVQFYVRGLPDQMEEMAFFLSELTLRPRILERAMNREISKEKSVILEEHFWYEDIPEDEVEENVWRAMYRDHPVGQPIDGTPETIEAIKRKYMVARWRRTFRPENMLIVVHGNVSERMAVKCVKLNFLVRRRKRTEEPAVWTPPSFRTQSFDKRVKLERRALKKFYIAIGFPTRGFKEPNRYALWVLSRVLGEGWGSLIMTEIREKYGIGYHPFSDVVELSDSGMFLIAGHFVPKHLVKAIKLTQSLVQRLLVKLVDKDTLEAAKTSIVADFRNWVEISGWVSEHIYEEWMAKGDDWSNGSKIEPIEKVFEKVKEVTAEEVRRAARRIFAASRLFVSVIGPFTDELEQQIMQLLKDWDFSAKAKAIKKLPAAEENPAATEKPAEEIPPAPAVADPSAIE